MFGLGFVLGFRLGFSLGFRLGIGLRLGSQLNFGLGLGLSFGWLGGQRWLVGRLDRGSILALRATEYDRGDRQLGHREAKNP